MTRGNQPPDLQDFDARLRAARAREDAGANDPAETATGGDSGAGAGYRVGVELFAGMLFGGGVGWLLDHWLGTKPWLMVGLFILGAAAGLLNSYRAVMQANRTPAAGPGADERHGGRTKD
jgi:ATP synthase protein I